MAELALQTVLRIKTTDCISCGVVIGLEASYWDERRKDHRQFYCPNGHTQYFTSESEAEKNARLLREEQERHKRTIARENEERAAREKAERKLKRVTAGTCPCCQRSFKQLRMHMANKHPDYHLKIGKPKLP